MLARKLVGVFNEPFFVEFHNDLLPTHGADVVRQTPGGHPADAVELWGAGREHTSFSEHRKATASLKTWRLYCFSAGFSHRNNATAG